MMFGVVVFPGSNCDHDCYHVLKHVLGQPVQFIWHQEETIDPSFKVIVLPGGFSYGDYLRTGAIARFSPIMKAVKRFAQNGGLVIGICNGFQILLEARLLPGAMLRNRGLRFICRDVYIRVENNKTPFTSECTRGQVLKIPIAHGEGNYFATPEVLKELRDNNQIVFRYCTSDGAVNEQANPNGSLDNIAGIINKEGNILGMMPHPERASEEILGNTDGLYIFRSIISSLGLGELEHSGLQVSSLTC
ncbi:MAG: phosphoribosylformylglycinamidine synthase subunit PurQ [Thermodesulfovibrionales bacterium]|nr:phosphoribosylformylglycinamidine synthase subunit PurQ [Thermodesulfovibrionales bacterium]